MSHVASRVEAIRAQLDAGADPNRTCGSNNKTLVGYVVWMATTQRDAERQAVLRLLLERGGKPVELEHCRMPGNGDCAQVLLPILEEFSR